MTDVLPLTVTFLQTPRDAGLAVFPLTQSKTLSPALQSLDTTAGGIIARTLAHNESFTAKGGEVLHLTLPSGCAFSRVALLGMEEGQDPVKAEEAGEKLWGALEKAGAKTISFMASEGTLAVHVAAGATLRAWQFSKYKAQKPDTPVRLEKLDVILENCADAQTLWEASLAPVIAGICSARHFISEPPNVIYPESYAAQIATLLRPLGVSVDIIDEKRLEKMGCGGLLCVGQGSTRLPRLVVMQWNGNGEKTAPLAFVGKGITFDTGGISIKPSAKMDEMKSDMAGSAAVVGAMEALARAKSPAHVVGVVALAENMPSGSAYRPADIITTLSGKTVEVLNTDAEGRLVLADALTYAQKEFNPRAVIDLATLTGAIVVALGEEYAGAFANDDDLWERLFKAGAAAGEKYWRMPLDKAWKKQVESSVADLQNIGKVDRAAGSCVAAGFLEHFIEENKPWAHLDIAGVALFGKTGASSSKGATGFGVRTLFNLV